MFQELVSLFKSCSIQDIYLLGFVDIEDGAADFCPYLRYYYFEVGEKYIEFEYDAVSRKNRTFSLAGW